LGEFATHLTSPYVASSGAFLCIAGAFLFLASLRWSAVARIGLVLFVAIDVVAIQGHFLAGLPMVDPFQIPVVDEMRPPVPPPGPVQGPLWTDELSLAGYRLVNG
jgi:hypothetical protein